jgi:hypothetical protein
MLSLRWGTTTAIMAVTKVIHIQHSHQECNRRPCMHLTLGVGNNVRMCGMRCIWGGGVTEDWDK